MRDVKMEKYEFVPFAEPKAIEDVDAKELIQYIEECNLIAEKLAMVMGKGEINKNSGDKFAAILRKPLSQEQVLLKLLIALYKSVFDENGNLSGTKLSGELLRQKTDANNLDLAQDMLNAVSKNGRLMRSILG